MASVNADELENAMILAEEPGSADAWVCPRTGAVYIRSDLVGELEPLPDDIDDPDKYIAVPGLRSLDLGQALVLDFMRRHMAADEETVRHAFRRAGAYRRFSALVEERGMRDRWHAFRQEHTVAALRAWCEENGLQLDT